jgi:hypothetical protein
MEADEFLLVELMSWPLLLTLLEVNPVFEGLTDLILLLQQAPINKIKPSYDKRLSLFQMQSCKQKDLKVKKQN